MSRVVASTAAQWKGRVACKEDTNGHFAFRVWRAECEGERVPITREVQMLRDKAGLSLGQGWTTVCCIVAEFKPRLREEDG